VFCCLGFAVASLISNVDAAQPVVQAIVLPLSFISGVFVATSELPGWLAGIGKVFPVEHLAAALLAAYNPHTTGSGLRWGDLAILAAWGAAGLVIAIRRFRWLPRSGLAAQQSSPDRTQQMQTAQRPCPWQESATTFPAAKETDMPSATIPRAITSRRRDRQRRARAPAYWPRSPATRNVLRLTACSAVG
jgi:ABC-2 type transporter